MITVSGMYSCVFPESCGAIDVSDTSFDETFVAIPDAGYRFEGWQRRDRGLCGGSRSECALNTAGFAGNSALLSILSSDQTFFLDAEFVLDEQPSSLAPSEGLWVGTTDQNQALLIIVLSDGTFYLFYSLAGVPDEIQGVVQGSSSTMGSTFTSSDARDFDLDIDGFVSADINAQVTPQQLFEGSISYNNGSQVDFLASYSSDYEIVPSLRLLEGDYSGIVALEEGEFATELRFNADGAVSGSALGCQFTGTASTRPSGSVYDFSLRFGGSPCPDANQTFEGIIYFDVRTGTLFAVVPNRTRTDGFFFLVN
ncbi:MAG: hypothetical protein AAF098_11250 [Pseudomonadota bacterium]